MKRANPSTPSKPVGGGGLLRMQAYSYLKNRILAGELPPGVFLSERQVADWLKMSKTPVRAAFERLETEGFLSISPQQGVVVRDLSMTEIADHFELRTALECFVVSQLAASRLDAAQSKLLQENMEAQKNATRSANVVDGIRLDSEFHLLLCRFLGNQELLRVMSQLRERMVRVIQHALTRNTHRLNSVCLEHEGIVEALNAGDGTLASLRMSQHLESGRQTLLAPRRPPADS